MSSSPRNSGPSNRHGSDSEYGKKRKSFFPSSTRRDFKSSSNLTSASVPAAGPSSSSISRPPLRSDGSGSIDFAPRSRHRDSGSSGHSSLQGSRQMSYSKDSRHASFSAKHSYSSSYYKDRPSGAYGSFSSAKRAETEGVSGDASSRDVSSRDMVNGSSGRSDRHGHVRDSWSRSERSNPSSSGGLKISVASRFNPNSIPLSSRSGSNDLSSSASNDYKKDKHEDTASNRYQSYSSPRVERGDRAGPNFGLMGPNSRYSTPRERIRSSGLTNSVGSSRRSDSYYSKKAHDASYRYSRDFREGSLEDKSRRPYSAKSEDHYRKSISPLSEDHLSDNHSATHVETSNGSKAEVQDGNDAEHDDERTEQDEDEDEEEEEEDDEEDGEEEDEENDINDSDDNMRIDSANKLLQNGKDISNLVTKSSLSGFVDDCPESAQLPSEELSGDSALEYPDGCVYPQSKVEAEYSDLKLSFAAELEYQKRVSSCVSTVTELSKFPFFSYNLKRFTFFHKTFQHIWNDKLRDSKKTQVRLMAQYQDLSTRSERRMRFMEEQQKILHPPDDEIRKELEAIDIRTKNLEPEAEAPAVEQQAPVGRRGRRHGDSVTTEAEFQEILKSLKNEQDEDPVTRARHVAAEIPDLILDPLERHAFKFMDSNNLVVDRSSWEMRINTDFESHFSEKEHDLFCDAFCRAPKRFGEISRYMGGLRTFNECVMHYYITKKAVNYKFLVAQFKKTSSKNARRKKKVKAKYSALVEGPDILNSEADSGKIQSLEVIKNNVDTQVRKIDEQVTMEFELKAGDNELGEPQRKKARLDVHDFDKSHTTQNAPTEIELSNPLTVSGSARNNADSRLLQDSSAANAAPSNVTMDERDEAEEKASLRHITSYWSINEVEDFPRLLDAYGSRWSDISARLTTKSSTMVKNYYQRNAEKLGWVEIVSAADKKLGQSLECKHSLQKSEDWAYTHKKATEENGALSAAPQSERLSDIINQQGRPDAVLQQGLSASASNGYQDPNTSNTQAEHNHESKLDDTTSQTGLEKPSIDYLLNTESGSPEKRASISSAAQRTNNLSSLLNAPSSPAPASTTNAEPSEGKRGNTIESLLG